ncbi:MAG: cytidylate kinase-like family protein [Chloroflexota bacterium]|nr:cytidylate kinase-like family protein [Chloroflexota bacterium]
MPAITMNSALGCGAVEVGTAVARMLEMDYVDRLVLAEAAKRIGATVEAVAEKEQRVTSVRDRVARFLQRMLERSALSSASGEPYLGTGYDVLLSQQYTELEKESITTARLIDEKRFVEVTRAVIEDLAQAGNVVINGRASNMFLWEWPGVLHVGLFAHMEHRIQVLTKRLHIGETEAGDLAIRTEQARRAFYRHVFKVDPNLSSHYHLILNMDKLSVETAAELVVRAAKGL